MQSPELERFNKIDLGDSSIRVRDVFGEPSKRVTEKDGGERWTYTFGDAGPISEIVFFFESSREGVVDSKEYVPGDKPSAPVVVDSRNEFETIESPLCGRHYDSSEIFLIHRERKILIMAGRGDGEVGLVAYQSPQTFTRTVADIKSCPSPK
ncbi:MAG: hypothetical protein AAB250_05235 [Bdellovibrionota bacterium]